MKKLELLSTLALVSVVLFSGCQKDDSALFGTDQSGNALLKSGLLLTEPVDLGLAGDYAILAKTGITTTGVTSIVGNIGVSPIIAASMTGFGLIADGSGQFSTSPIVNGKIFAANYAIPTPANLTTTVLDMESAYTNAAGRAADVTELGTGNIGGLTLAPGVYSWSTPVTIPTDVTLVGDANDVWIFQISGGLTVASAKSVILSGGAQAKNIFWQVAGIATLGTTSNFSCIILSKTAIIMQTGAVMNGQALAQTAVTLDANTITKPEQSIVVSDITSPIVVSSVPANIATGVEFNAKVIVTFNEAIDSLSINASTFTLKQGKTAVLGAVTYEGLVATFTPAANLAASTVYTASVTAGVMDLAGNVLASEYAFSFTTKLPADITLPFVNSTDPINNTIGVDRNKVIAVTFSEAMDASTINASTFILMNGTSAVSGIVSYSGTTGTFTPSNALDANIVYTATITNGVRDLAGNALSDNTSWNFTTVIASSTLAPVFLGSATNYVILAKTAITNVPTSAITGDMGISPAAASYITGLSLTAATGYATSAQVTGSIFAADMANPTPSNLTIAVLDMEAAYTDAAGRPFPDFLEQNTGNIGGKTLTPGLYKWTNSVSMPSDVTISGGADDVWIFQISGNLTMPSGVRITLTGGTQAKNIFWQVAGAVTLGKTSHFEGNILSQTGINLQTGASINGRMLAQTAVTLQMNTVNQPQ